MATGLVFMQPVKTPRGDGFFIGYISGTSSCQVAIRSNGVQMNPVFLSSEVEPADETKSTRQSDRKPAHVLQVAQMPLDMPVS